MARIYKRRFELAIGDNAEILRVDLKSDNYNNGNSLRVTFLVQHDFNGSQSFAEISVFGLNRENENRIFEKYRNVTLQAGYPEIFGPIFKGQIVNVQREVLTSDGTRGIKMFCYSGRRETDTAFINQSFGPSTPIAEIIRILVAIQGFPVELVGDFSGLPLRSGGTVLQGDPKALIKSFERIYGFKHTIENNVALVVKDGAVREGDIYVLSARTGMKGSPVVTDTGIEVICALNPVIQLNQLIKIDSLSPEFAFGGAYWYKVPRSVGEGLYKVSTMIHAGDTHGAAWDTQIMCLDYNAAQRARSAQAVQ